MSDQAGVQVTVDQRTADDKNVPPPKPEPSAAEKVAESLVEAVKEKTRTSINVPDHAIRHSKTWQIYTRLARPTLEWVCVGSAIELLIIGPYTGHMVTEGFLTIGLGFIGGNVAARVVERLKGIA